MPYTLDFRVSDRYQESFLLHDHAPSRTTKSIQQLQFFQSPSPSSYSPSAARVPSYSWWAVPNSGWCLHNIRNPTQGSAEEPLLILTTSKPTLRNGLRCQTHALSPMLCAMSQFRFVTIERCLSLWPSSDNFWITPSHSFLWTVKKNRTQSRFILKFRPATSSSPSHPRTSHSSVVWGGVVHRSMSWPAKSMLRVPMGSE